MPVNGVHMEMINATMGMVCDTEIYIFGIVFSLHITASRIRHHNSEYLITYARSPCIDVFCFIYAWAEVTIIIQESLDWSSASESTIK